MTYLVFLNFLTPKNRKIDLAYQENSKTIHLLSGQARPILRIPNNVVTPYNAQVTLHFYPAFWALFLPVTVAGRVSDIWRSYIAQALFKHLGLSLGFLPR